MHDPLCLRVHFAFVSARFLRTDGVADLLGGEGWGGCGGTAMNIITGEERIKKSR